MKVFFIDTDSELWYTHCDELGLKVIQMPYILNGQQLYDDGGRNTDYDQFHQAIRKGGSSKTAALNTEDYLQILRPYFANGDDIFYLTFSHQMSATFEFLDVAVKELSEQYPNATFRTFDTKSISMGAGFQCYYAGKMFKEGHSFDEIIEFLKDFTNHSACYFAVDDIDHLRKGGRISGFAAFAGKLLGIRPILHVGDDGKITKFDTVRGSKMVATYLTNLVKCDIADDGQHGIWIMEADNKPLAELLKDKLSQLYPDAPIHIQQVGPVIGSHCGPGTVGVIFYAKQR